MTQQVDQNDERSDESLTFVRLVHGRSERKKKIN